jgi:hypothetical protein
VKKPFRPTPHVSSVEATDADRDRYWSTLNDLLQCVDFPKELLLFNDLKLCPDEQHDRAIHKYMLTIDISEAVVDTARATIPLTCNRHSGGRIPDWCEHVMPPRNKPLFLASLMDWL